MTAAQAEDLASLQQAIASLGSDLVVVGAAAYLAFFPDGIRQTEDIDVAVALDLDDWHRLESILTRDRWVRKRNQEQRWRGPRRTCIDILPAGPRLRATRQLTWPRSGMVMSLEGFDHVFERAVEMEVAAGMRARIAPPVVLFLLKAVSYLDAPQPRRKDLVDLHGMLRNYGRDDDRVFSDSVFAARLSHSEFVPAYLLGVDLAELCSANERTLVERFLALVSAPASAEFTVLLEQEVQLEPSEEHLLLRLGALRQGLGAASCGP